jgi:hypothetical protein
MLRFHCLRNGNIARSLSSFVQSFTDEKELPKQQQQQVITTSQSKADLFQVKKIKINTMAIYVFVFLYNLLTITIYSIMFIHAIRLLFQGFNLHSSQANGETSLQQPMFMIWISGRTQ